MERTLVLLKPDAVQRQLVGRIVARIERKGLKIVALKMMTLTESLAREMYAPHKGKDFYEPLVAFVTAGPLVAAVLEGIDAVSVWRKMIGPTFGPAAPAGTVRGDFGMSMRYNLVHGSDSAVSAAREIPLFFTDEELLRYDLAAQTWIYARRGEELI